MADKSEMIRGRKEPGYRDLRERLADFTEVEKMLSDTEVTEQAARCLTCGTPFCHGYACPLANVIPEINELIASGRWEEALKLLLSTHPFPEFTARICPALCEGSCVLSINDQAVSIRQIEKMIVEKGFEQGWIRPQPPRKRREEKIAVIGSGPAGLAVANRLNQLGYQVTILEKEKNPGGLLMYGIPNFKLEKAILTRRINLMKSEGIRFETEVLAGLDISFNYLKRNFSVIALTGGSEKPRDLNIPGRNLKGINFALELLKAQNKRIAGEQITPEEDLSAIKKQVVVIGGGDTGSDCVGTVLRQGAKSVLQLEILPRLPEERSNDNPWPQWPRIDRLSSSHQEGGERRWAIQTLEFKGKPQGCVEEVICGEVDWQEKEGKLIPLPVKGSEFRIKANLVLLALGFTGPGPNPLTDQLELKRDERGNIWVDNKHMTSMAGLFSAGDMARGQSLVVRAIGDGIATANDIDQYLKS